jgi:hypothetical protein
MERSNDALAKREKHQQRKVHLTKEQCLSKIKE